MCNHDAIFEDDDPGVGGGTKSGWRENGIDAGTDFFQYEFLRRHHLDDRESNRKGKYVFHCILYLGGMRSIAGRQ